MKMFLLVLAFAACATSSAQDIEGVESNPVSLGDGDLTLELQVTDNASTLVLRHTQLGGNITLRPVECHLNSESFPNDKPRQWDPGTVRQIVAGRYQQSGMLFVIRTQNDEETAIWCGLIFPMSGESDGPLIATFDYLTACEPSYRILSASGIGRMAAVSIIIGEMSGEVPGGVSRGIVITNYCAYATGSLSDSQIGHFTPIYEREQ